MSVFDFKRPDRLPRWELGFWSETVTRWRGEGLGQDRLPQDEFGIESWYTAGGMGGSKPSEMWRLRLGDNIVDRVHEFADFNLVDYSAGYEEKVIEDTSKYVIYQDAQGMVKKDLKETESMTQFIKNPVETEEDFSSFRERFDPDDEGRYMKGYEDILQNRRDAGVPICLTVPGFYGQARWMFGPEKTLFNFAAEPELMADVMEFWGDFLIENSRRLFESNVPIDFALVWEDMAYKGGSLISPTHFRELMLPQYRRVTRFFKRNGIKTVLVDCDGDVSELIPLFIDGGIHGMFPFEVASGMDVRDFRKEYPKFILLGGIDKREMAAGGKALRTELEGKVQLVEKGGYIPCCDHVVPADVSFRQFKEYMTIKDNIASEVLK